MNTFATRHTNRHRPEPVREGFVWRGKNPIYCAGLRREIRVASFEVALPIKIIALLTGLIATSNGRATTQIPIDRRFV